MTFSKPGNSFLDRRLSDKVSDLALWEEVLGHGVVKDAICVLLCNIVQHHA